MLTAIEPSARDSLQVDQRGGRLLPTWIDKVGRETPDKVWASVPRSTNLKDGFRDLRYHHLVAAIDAAAWWIESVIGRSTQFETVAYMGYIAVMAYLVHLANVGPIQAFQTYDIISSPWL